jgi:phage terminase large subunit-like protein
MGGTVAGALPPDGLVRVDPVAFIEGELRHTTDRWAGKPFKLRAFQREFLAELFREVRGRRRYTRAVWGLPRKNGKSEIAAAIGTKLLCADGVFGAEVISVAGDKPQARIVFDAAKRMVQFSPRLSATLRIFRDAIEDPSTDSIWRVMSADAPLKHGLRPSAVIFDELHVQPSRELWDVLESGFGSRTEPLMLGITTAGFDRASLLGDLVREGEQGKDRAFLYRWIGLAENSELDYRDPRAWRLANPALSCRDPFLVEARLAEMARRLPENQFRRLHLNQWTSARDVAFPAGAWESAGATRDVPDGTEVVIAFVAARTRDTVAIVGCVRDDPFVFPIRIWDSSERVDPSDVADELRAVCRRFHVLDLLVSEHDWSWVLLELADEGLPVTKVPRSPQRLAQQWQQFYDAVIERRLTHDPDPMLARHAANLGLISGPSGLRPDLDVSAGAPIAGAVAAMIAFDGVSRVEPVRAPRIHVYDPNWAKVTSNLMLEKRAYRERENHRTRATDR